MQTTYNPEFLEQRAQMLREAGGAGESEAFALDQCAQQWRADQAALHAAHTENTQLQLDVNAAARTLRPKAVA